MKKNLFTLILFPFILFASDCSSYYKPEKFYKAPEMLIELLDETFQNKIFFQIKNLKVKY